MVAPVNKPSTSSPTTSLSRVSRNSGEEIPQLTTAAKTTSSTPTSSTYATAPAASSPVQLNSPTRNSGEEIPQRFAAGGVASFKLDATDFSAV